MLKKENVSSFYQRGFTVVELMITLALIGIMAVIAVPNFKSFIDNQRVKKAAMQIHSGLMYTRSEAIKRNGRIYVNSNGGSATGWTNGWSIATVNKTYAECISDATNCLRIIPAASGVYIVNAAPTTVEYNKQGRAIAAGTFELCDDDNKAIKRIVTISSTGVPNIDQGGACP